MTTEVPETTEAVATTTEAAATTTDAIATTTEAAATTTELASAIADTDNTSPPTTAVGAGSYEASPDGSPLPAVVIFDTNQITLSGAVPSEASADGLVALALANSQTSAPIVNLLTVNPAVPAGVGVRVLELESPRFPEGSAEILPEHARQLDRVAALMAALPHTTVEVVGHADQRGDEATNLAISQQRAEAVVEHLVSRGIDASRLSSRAVGEADLLSLDDDIASLALNRRTEFIIYGALLPPPSAPSTTDT